MSGLVELARKVPALFRRSGKAEENRAAAELDRSAARLAAADDPERERIRQEAAWEVLLRGLLEEYPDAAPELRAVAAELRERTAAPEVNVYQQRVDGSGAGAQGPNASVI